MKLRFPIKVGFDWCGRISGQDWYGFRFYVLLRKPWENVWVRQRGR